MRLVALALVLVACRDPTAACWTLAQKDWACSRDDHHPESPSVGPWCPSAFEIDARWAARVRHQAACANAATCDDFRRCKDYFDATGGVIRVTWYPLAVSRAGTP
jgi:hypothetical protein